MFDKIREDRMKGLLAIGLVGVCSLVQAQCSDGIEQALRTFYAQPALEGGVVAADCKPWPPAANHVVAAVMAFAPADESDDFRNVLGVLALVDTHTHRVLHGRRFWVGEDAATKVGRGSLALDTADYALAPGIRALGLRFRNASSGPGVAERRYSDELTLLVPRTGELEPVLKLTMEVARAVEGCLGKCKDATWDEATLTIAVGKPGAKGWNDLLVTARVVGDGTADPPASDATPRKERVIYRYNGQAYSRETPDERWWEAYCCHLTWDALP